MNGEYTAEMAAGIEQSGASPWAPTQAVLKQDEQADDLADDPWAQICNAADELLGREPRFATKEKAISEVLKRNPRLYDEYIAGRVGRAGMKPGTPVKKSNGKRKRVRLSKEAEAFVEDFTAWLSESGSQDGIAKAAGGLHVLGFDDDLFSGLDW